MDVNVSAVARWNTSARTHSHADGSIFVSRKTTVSGFATYSTRTFLADGFEAAGNKSPSRNIDRSILLLESYDTLCVGDWPVTLRSALSARLSFQFALAAI
jgi:hypothetical protein